MFRAAFHSVDMGCDFLSTRQIDGDIRDLRCGETPYLDQQAMSPGFVQRFLLIIFGEFQCVQILLSEDLMRKTGEIALHLDHAV